MVCKRKGCIFVAAINSTTMKPVFSIMIVAASMLGLVSCKSNKELTRNQEQKPVSIDKDMIETAVPAIPFTIDTAWVSDLVLHAVVAYTGPKTGVEFKLVWNGAWLKMYPPKAMVFLEPVCSKTSGNTKVKQSMSFDISALKASNSEFSILLRDYKQGFDIH